MKANKRLIYGGEMALLEEATKLVSAKLRVFRLLLTSTIMCFMKSRFALFIKQYMEIMIMFSPIAKAYTHTNWESTHLLGAIITDVIFCFGHFRDILWGHHYPDI